MGVDGLHDFLRKNYPEFVKVLPLENLYGLDIAIDTPGYLYRLGTGVVTKQIDRLRRIAELYVFLRKFGIKCHFVFDGVPPPEKQECIEERKAKKEKAKENIYDAKNLLTTYQNQIELWKTEASKMPTVKKKRFLIDSIIDDPITDYCFDSNSLIDKVKHLTTKKNELEKKLKSLLGGPAEITKKEKDEVKNMLESLGANVIQAEEDGEATCSMMNRLGLVYAEKKVVSDDGDCIPYGGVKMIRLDSIFKDCVSYVEYDIKEFINACGVNLNQFWDIAAISGCDFSKGVKGFGFVKAFNLIKSHKNIEGILNFLQNKNCKITNKDEVFQAFEKLNFAPARRVYSRWCKKSQMPIKEDFENAGDVLNYFPRELIEEWKTQLELADLVEIMGDDLEMEHLFDQNSRVIDDSVDIFKNIVQNDEDIDSDITEEEIEMQTSITEEEIETDDDTEEKEEIQKYVPKEDNFVNHKLFIPFQKKIVKRDIKEELHCQGWILKRSKSGI